jgi:response regulator NasT
MNVNAIVVCDESKSYDLIEQVLMPSGYDIVFHGTSLQQLLQNAVIKDPQLIIISIMSAYDGLIEQLKIINQQYPLPIVIFTQDDSDDTIEHAINAGVSAYVVDGLLENRVLPILRTAMARFDQHQSMRQELDDLKTTLAERKVIDRAKGLLMQQRQCSEDEAYKLLRTTAMNQNIRLASLAQQIIDTASLLSSNT